MSEDASQPYRVVVLGTDATWADTVADRCAANIGQLVDGADLVAVERELPPPPDPAEAPPQTLVLFLADEDSREDERLLRNVEDAREQLIPVLPVVKSGADVFAVLPKLLRRLNAIAWDRDGSHAIGEVARLLGLAESERRLFLSYRRLETSSLALQLREHLSRRGFDVFLDRFSVPPAADFQERINVELADKAFVLLLESRSAVGSEWVQHEVAYALSHGISLLALCMPETVETEQFASVDEAFRTSLCKDDLEAAANPVGPDDRVLKNKPLEDLLDQIEARYARQMRRRRTALLGSLEQWLDEAGRTPEALSDQWALSAHDPDGVFMITPGAPVPRDLRRLDEIRRLLPVADGAGDVEGHLLFAAPVQAPRDARLIEWIVERRPLSARPYLLTPELLGI